MILDSRLESYQPIVTDFGKSRLIKDGKARKRHNKFQYLAPEVWDGCKESTANDIFLFGKMLEEATSKRSFTKEFKDLIHIMTLSNPKGRPSIEEIISKLR